MSVKQSKQHGAPPTSTVLCVWHLRCSSYQSPFVVAPLLEACCEQVNMRNNIVGLLFCHQQTTTTATFTCLQRSRKSAAAAKEIQDNNCTMDLFATGELVLLFVNYCDVRTSCKVNSMATNSEEMLLVKDIHELIWLAQHQSVQDSFPPSLHLFCCYCLVVNKIKAHCDSNKGESKEKNNQNRKEESLQENVEQENWIW